MTGIKAWVRFLEADQLGSGARTMFNYGPKYSCLQPESHEADFFRITLPLGAPITRLLVKSNGDNIVIEQNPIVNPTVNLSPALQRLINLLRDNPQETYATLSQKLGKHRDTIHIYLKQLVELGFLCREGSDKDGHWEVLLPEDGQ